MPFDGDVSQVALRRVERVLGLVKHRDRWREALRLSLDRRHGLSMAVQDMTRAFYRVTEKVFRGPDRLRAEWRRFVIGLELTGFEGASANQPRWRSREPINRRST
jgi:hypothetical protein